MKLDRQYQTSARICILGGGFGGLYTALYLHNFQTSRFPSCQITLIEPKDHFLFTPLLYELLTEELQPWEITPSYQKLLVNTNIELHQQKVQKVDLCTRQITLAGDQQLAYDYLVLAVGSQAQKPDIPGADTYALDFRSLADADRLNKRLRMLTLAKRQPLHLAIIGGGANGVELACKLADRLLRQARIYLIERGKGILKTFPFDVQAAAHRALSSRGVQVCLETEVETVKADHIILVRHARVTTLPVDLVVWTTGTQSLEWVSQLSCQQNSQGKLLTLPTLQLVDYPDVFALGDLAAIYNVDEPVPTTAQAAYQQARYAAINLKALLTKKRLRHFRYWHLGDMLTLGKGAAVISCHCLNLEGPLAALIRRLVYIQRLPTARHRRQVFKHLVLRAALKMLRLGWRQLAQLSSSLKPGQIDV